MKHFLIPVIALCAAFAAKAEVVTKHGVSAFGALKYGVDFTHFDYVNPDAPKGGIYKGRSTFSARTYDSLNPYILKGEAALEIDLFIFDRLLTRAWDEPDAAYGLLAASVTYPADRSWAEFELRPEARFADGTQVTADDVVFSLSVLQEKGAPSYRTIFADLGTATALSPTRVRFDFREGASTRDLPMLAGDVPIMSAADWAGIDFAESSLRPPLGSGPYAVGDVKPGRSITYVRRGDYWAKDLPVNRGRWNFDELHYEYFKDSTAAFEAFKSGAYEFHEEFFSKLWATAYDFPSLDKGWVKRDVLADGRASGTQGYWFNTRRAKFTDPTVRQALSLAFDFEWSNRTLFYDLYSRTTSFFQGSALAATGRASATELELLTPLSAHLPDTVFSEDAYQPPTNDGSGRLRRALRLAGKMLDQAGWRVGADGMRRNEAGEPLEIEFLSNGPAFERITGPYVQNLKQLGVDAEFRLIDSAQYQQRVEDFDFDVVVARLPIPETPGPELRNLWHSVSVDSRGSLNLAGVNNPAVDALIEAVIAAKDRDAHAVAVSALDRALRSLHIWVPQWTKASHTIAYWDIYGRPDIKPAFHRGIVQTWWIDEEKQAALDKQRGQQ